MKADPPKPKSAAAAGVARRRKPSDGGLRGKVKAHDPFELIRWLAFSQPDPRKALAELVQNSLDAGAATVRVTRERIRGLPCLRVMDDGEGVIPELERADALRYLATHIGHSRKRNLSPRQRHTLMTQGQYGIGLLGFWSLGERLEIRSAMPGQPALRLVLHRDSPDYLIEPLRGRLPLEERWTEVLVVGVHPAAQVALIGRRAADYLAAELRGQLLSRAVSLIYEDRMSRGSAQKLIAINPPRFLGERVGGVAAVEVPGYAPVCLELYLRGSPSARPLAERQADAFAGEPGEDGERLSLYASGTLVAHSFSELGALGLDHRPWTDSRLIGMVDFPDFTVPPGSRRGVVSDAAAEAFVQAMQSIEARVTESLADLDRRQSAELDRTLVRDLQRAFRDLLRAKPRYELPTVGDREGERSPGGGAEPTPQAGAEAPDAAASPAGLPLAAAFPEPAAADDALLFPPGPLFSAAIKPATLKATCGSRRTVTCLATDAAGRPAAGLLIYHWTLDGPIGALSPADAGAAAVVFTAGEAPAAGTLRVEVTSGPLAAAAEAAVLVADDWESGRAGEGIPAPVLVEEPGAHWRSRWHEERWEINTGHRDYRAAAERPALKLRYLAALFAKEIVLRSSGDPRLEAPLEQLVEVFSFADQRLARSTFKSREQG